jgi:hypothetical protein
MQIYRALQYSFPAIEKSSRKRGVLNLVTRIRLKGNPDDGQIPVEVNHEYRFNYQKPWLDENGNEIHTVERAFSVYEERNIYCKRFFESSTDWSEIENKRNA